MILFPNAKINLGLDILRKRPDGYHDVETVMYPIPWTDVLELTPSGSGETSLTCSGRGVACEPEKNLVMKAYRALERRMGRLPGVDIHLRKVIPDGAGLGGGSADAAFTLRGLNELFDLGLTQEELAGIGATLGADVPFFIYNRPMLCTGTGTEMRPYEVSLGGMWILVAKPEVSVPTAAAYSKVTPAVPEVRIAETLQQPIGEWHGVLKNDFEASVFPAYPAVEEVKARMASLGPVYGSMSGSGSAVFGVFDRDILAEDVAELFPNCQLFSGRLGE